MRRSFFILVVLVLAGVAWAAKVIPNGSSSQTITVVIKDATGVPATGITIANLDLFCVKDGDQMSAKVDLAAGTSDHAAWSSGKAFEIGLGLYRIDIPDTNLSDGVGTMLTYVIDDTVGTNLTTFYEVQLGVAADVRAINGSVNGLAGLIDVFYTHLATAFDSTNGYFVAALDPTWLAANIDDSAANATAAAAAILATPAQKIVTDAGGRVAADMQYADGAAFHSTTAGRLAANMTTMYNVATQNLTGASVNQTVNIATQVPQVIPFVSLGGTQTPQVSVTGFIGTAVTEAGGAGRLAGSVSTWGNVATPVATAASVNQTADAYVPALAAQTAAEKIDTANELRTLLTGGTTAVATTANLPTNFSTVTVTDGKIASTATATLSDEALNDLKARLTRIYNALWRR
jgi:hypothetical protein